MRQTIWDKRIPTLLGIMIITIGIGITSFLVGRGTIFTSQAGPSQSPQNIRITNISDNSFTVTYTTSDKVLGSVNFGKDKNLGQTALDDRDQQSGSVNPYTIHSITVKNRMPSATYYFTIGSAQNTFLNNGVPFTVSTGPTLQAPSLNNKLAGKVTLPNGSSPKEAIVYVTANNAQTLSTLVKPDGSYILPLDLLRTKDLSSYKGSLENSVIQMLVIGDRSLVSNVLLSGKNIGQVPIIILGNNYDFTTNNSPASSASAVPISFPSISFENPLSGTKSPEIILPKKGQGFSDQQPQFKGVALPNSEVKIIIHSQGEIQTQVKTDAFGNWIFRPSTPLAPGQHTISIITKDAFGILRTVTQSFVVYASGTQIAGAIPSVAPTPTSTPISTPTPTTVPTAAPALTPTPTPTLIPTQTPAPTPTLVPTVPINSPTPLLTTKTPLGNPNILVAGLFGIAVTILGGFLFLLTRGNI